MTNQAIESATTALAQFAFVAPEAGAPQAKSSAPAPIGPDVVARSTNGEVALAASGYSFAYAKPGRHSSDDGEASAHDVFPGGATALDPRLDNRTNELRHDRDSNRRRRSAEPEPEPEFARPAGDHEPANAEAGNAPGDIVRFAGTIVASHRDDVRDEPWPLWAHS